MIIQSIMFPINKFTLSQAASWIKKNNYKLSFYGKQPETLGKFHRFRQAAPKDTAKYYTKKLDNGIIFIFMK